MKIARAKHAKVMFSSLTMQICDVVSSSSSWFPKLPNMDESILYSISSHANYIDKFVLFGWLHFFQGSGFSFTKNGGFFFFSVERF